VFGIALRAAQIVKDTYMCVCVCVCVCVCIYVYNYGDICIYVHICVVYCASGGAHQILRKTYVC